MGSGITVALVAVPLAGALSIASSAAPIMGLKSAIYGPLLAGILGGSHYTVLGPAASLVGVLHALEYENGIEIIPLVAIVGGVAILAVWGLKLEKYFLILPLSVLGGFSFSVGITMGLN